MDSHLRLPTNYGCKSRKKKTILNRKLTNKRVNVLVIRKVVDENRAKIVKILI